MGLRVIKSLGICPHPHRGESWTKSPGAPEPPRCPLDSHGHLKLLHPLPLRVLRLAEELEALLALQVDQVEAVGPLGGGGMCVRICTVHSCARLCLHVHVCVCMCMGTVHSHACLCLCVHMCMTTVHSCGVDMCARVHVHTPLSELPGTLSHPSTERPQLNSTGAAGP